MQKQYEDGRVAKLSENLTGAGIAPELIAEIMAGGEAIRHSSSAEAKADWMREAMQRMDRLVDRDTRCAVREACACCLGGKRLKLSKAIAKDHATLEERIAAANETKFVFGHSVTLEEDGRVLVRFAPEGEPSYHCVCLRGAEEPISATYCYCCAGHAKHHLQHALGRKLSAKVRSSALSSGGTRPCTFLFTIQEET